MEPAFPRGREPYTSPYHYMALTSTRLLGRRRGPPQDGAGAEPLVLEAQPEIAALEICSAPAGRAGLASARPDARRQSIPSCDTFRSRRIAAARTDQLHAPDRPMDLHRVAVWIEPLPLVEDRQVVPAASLHRLLIMVAAERRWRLPESCGPRAGRRWCRARAGPRAGTTNGRGFIIATAGRGFVIGLRLLLSQRRSIAVLKDLLAQRDRQRPADGRVIDGEVLPIRWA